MRERSYIEKTNIEASGGVVSYYGIYEHTKYYQSCEKQIIFVDTIVNQ